MNSSTDLTSASRNTGPATFFRLDASQKIEAGMTVIVGVPFDGAGAIRPGSRFAPARIREASKLYVRSELRSSDERSIYGPGVIDYGDVPVIQESISDSYSAIQDAISSIVKAGGKPVAVGGDHSISLPLLRAVANQHGPVALVHFDAHLDIVDSYYNGRIRYNNGTPFRRAVEEGLIDCARSIQIGMNGSIFSGMERRSSEELGFCVLDIEEFCDLGPNRSAQKIVDRVKTGAAYLTFDIDVIDVAFAPGSGAPEVGGLSSREALHTLRKLNGISWVGCDFVEVNPLFDHSDMTTVLAANLLFEIVGLVHNDNG